MPTDALGLRQLGILPYESVWQEMSNFTNQRGDSTRDELWLVQHPPVFTQGQAGKREHILDPKGIPVVQSDRGGQVTYHGPGQLIVYPLINLKRRKLNVRQMVSLLEDTAIDLLSRYDIASYAKADAPGVYTNLNGVDAKIASIGLRVRRGCCFHGMSINVDIDLSPFEQINPCGYSGLKMTQLRDLISPRPTVYSEVEESIPQIIANKLKSDICFNGNELPKCTSNTKSLI